MKIHAARPKPNKKDMASQAACKQLENAFPAMSEKCFHTNRKSAFKDKKCRLSSTLWVPFHSIQPPASVKMRQHPDFPAILGIPLIICGVTAIDLHSSAAGH